MPIWLGMFLIFVAFILGILITALGASSKMRELGTQILDLQDQLDNKEHFIKKYCVCNFMPKEESDK